MTSSFLLTSMTAASPPPVLDEATRTQLTGFAARYLQDRADRLNVEQPQAADRTALTGVPVTERLSARLASARNALDARRELLKRVDGGSSRAEVRVLSPRFDTQGDRVTVRLIEDTRLHYARVYPGSPTYEEYSLPHLISFVRTPTGWRMDSAVAESADGSIPPSTQPEPVAGTQPPVFVSPDPKTTASAESVPGDRRTTKPRTRPGVKKDR